MSTDAEQSRREKAEAWAKSKLPRLIEYQNEQDGENYGMADAWNADDVAAEMEDAFRAGQRDRQAEIDAKDAEIAALREAVRDASVVLRYKGFNVVAWALRVPAVRRALEAKS